MSFQSKFMAISWRASEVHVGSCHDLGAGAETADAAQHRIVVRGDLRGAEHGVVDGGMGIAHQRHRIALGQGAAGGGIDAVVALQAADHQVIDAT